jgi:hypothetical protein
MEVIANIFNLPILNLLGYASLFFSIGAIVIIIYHWRFFKRAEKSELSKRLILVFLSDLLMYLSLAMYGLNWVFMDGGGEWRVEMKIFQVVAILFNTYALIHLARYYMRIK